MLLLLAALVFGVFSLTGISAHAQTTTVTPPGTPSETQQPPNEEPAQEAPDSGSENTQRNTFEVLEQEPDSNESEAEEQEAEKPKDETDKKAEDQAALDADLLGNWVFIVDGLESELEGTAVLDAVKRCLEFNDKLTVRANRQTNIDPPDIKSLFGDLLFYRTERGLHRLDLRQGLLSIFLAQARATNAQGRVLWVLQGQNNQSQLTFVDMKPRGGKGFLMLENQSVYLKCPKLPVAAGSGE